MNIKYYSSLYYIIHNIIDGKLYFLLIHFSHIVKIVDYKIIVSFMIYYDRHFLYADSLFLCLSISVPLPNYASLILSIRRADKTRYKLIHFKIKNFLTSSHYIYNANVNTYNSNYHLVVGIIAYNKF